MSWTTRDKCCATCANWGGPRKVNYAGAAETDQPSTRGKCYMGKGNVIPGPCAMSSASTCSCYQKWGAVKF